MSLPPHCSRISTQPFPQKESRRCCERRLKTFGIAGFAVLLACTSAQAQLIPDRSLGPESSAVAPIDALRDRIVGGAARGPNLFHSFQDFNVGDGRGVYFANPAGIANILTRVTGGNGSDILGTLGVLGNANLYLINPNGIYFGPNSHLDVSGSFLATTSEAVWLGNSGYFSATDLPGSQLLSIQPGAFFSNALSNHQAEIRNQGNLAVGAGETLRLQGETVTSEGSLTAPGGRVELLGDRVNLLGNATIDVSAPTGGGTVLVGGDYQGQGPVPTATQTFIGPKVEIRADAIFAGNGGTVIVWADDTTEFYGTISARGGSNSGDGGFVEVSGSQVLNFQGEVNTLAPNGKAGTLLLDPTDLTVTSGASGPNTLNVATINNAGTNVNLQADRDITFNAPINMTNLGVGLAAIAGNDITVNQSISTQGGAVEFTAGRDIVIGNTVEISTFPTGGGRGGNVSFDAGGKIALNSGSQITTGLPSLNSTLSGQAGNIKLSGNGEVSITGSTITARSNNNTRNSNDFTVVEVIAREGSVLFDNVTLSTTNRGSGFAGDISIGARDRVSLTNQTRIFSNGRVGRILIGGFSDFPNTPSPQAVEISQSFLETSNGLTRTPSNRPLRAGNIGIIALGPVSIRDRSVLKTSTVRFGNGGNVVILSEGEVRLSNRSQIRALVERGAVGRAGDVSIVARSLALTDRSQIVTSVLRPPSSATIGGVGIGGDILISVSDSVLLTNDSDLLSSAELDSFGNAGNIVVIAGGGVILRNSSTISVDGAGFSLASLFGRSPRFGDPGNIGIVANSILLDRDSRLSALSRSGNNANIVLEVGVLVGLLRGSSITTEAFSDGSGGNITIFSGTAVLANLFEDSDIVANAFRGRGGNIRLSSPLSRRFQRFLPNRTPESDINASSELGIDGNIYQDFPEIEIEGIQVPIDSLNVESLNQNICAVEDEQIAGGSSFAVTGRGGLPANPREPLTPLTGIVEWATFEEESDSSAVVPRSRPTTPDRNQPREIQQAQGWVVTPDGTVMLVADASSTTAIAPFAHPNCPYSVNSHQSTVIR